MMRLELSRKPQCTVPRASRAVPPHLAEQASRPREAEEPLQTAIRLDAIRIRFPFYSRLPTFASWENSRAHGTNLRILGLADVHGASSTWTLDVGD